MTLFSREKGVFLLARTIASLIMHRLTEVLFDLILTQQPGRCPKKEKNQYEYRTS